MSDDDLVGQLRSAVARLVPDGVVVRPAPDGFAVGYPEPLVMKGPNGPSTTCLWAIVGCEPATRTYRITDVVTGAGVDSFDLSRSAFTFRGRVAGDRRARTYGTLPDGTRGVVHEQVHSAAVLHTAIRQPAAALGWREKQPAAVLLGKVVGIGTAAAVVLAGLVVGVLALSGRLG